MQQTNRGFNYIKFTDSYGAKCSLQESSSARILMDDGTVTDGKIWFGIDRDMNGIVPESGRMHLTQTHVKELLPLLIHFAEHGDLFDFESGQNQDDNLITIDI